MTSRIIHGDREHPPKIYGRHRGVDVEWTHERFATVIRHDVEDALARQQPIESVWARVRAAYGLVARCQPSARDVVDRVVHAARSRAAAARR